MPSRRLAGHQRRSQWPTASRRSGRTDPGTMSTPARSMLCGSSAAVRTPRRRRQRDVSGVADNTPKPVGAGQIGEGDLGCRVVGWVVDRPGQHRAADLQHRGQRRRARYRGRYSKGRNPRRISSGHLQFQHRLDPLAVVQAHRPGDPLEQGPHVVDVFAGLLPDVASVQSRPQPAQVGLCVCGEVVDHLPLARMDGSALGEVAPGMQDVCLLAQPGLDLCRQRVAARARIGPAAPARPRPRCRPPASPVCPRPAAPTARRPGPLPRRTAAGCPARRRGPARGARSPHPVHHRAIQRTVTVRTVRPRRSAAVVAAQPNSGPGRRSTRAARPLRCGPERPGCTVSRQRSGRPDSLPRAAAAPWLLAGPSTVLSSARNGPITTSGVTSGPARRANCGRADRPAWRRPRDLPRIRCSTSIAVRSRPWWTSCSTAAAVS